MQLSMIVATDSSGNIGRGNTIPWNNKEDMKFFKERTMGKPCIMGMNTFKSLKKPLEGRLNIVITKSHTTSHENVRFVSGVYDALKIAKDFYDINPDPSTVEEVMITGGKQIYEMFLPFVDSIYLTTIKLTADDCDVNISDMLTKIHKQFDVVFLKSISGANICACYRQLSPDTRDIIKSMRG